MNRYMRRGVSAAKEDVHKAIAHIDKGLYPQAFCKILPDILGGDPDYCNIMHADGAGTKSSLAYIYWRETGDLSVWRGIAQDAIVMNLDDLLCVGATSGMLLSSTIGRNKQLIPGEVIGAVINGTEEILAQMRDLGVEIYLTGGETADVGDLVRTIIVDSTVTCRMRRSDIIDNAHIADGDVSYDPAVPDELVYSGSRELLAEVPGTGLTVGELILSPTRTYAPLVAKLLKEMRPAIHGLIHCTGGAQTKVMNFVTNKHIIKDHLLPVPPLFQMIAEESGADAAELYQVFNMGHRLEAYLPAELAEEAIAVARHFNIDAQIIGRVEASEENRLTLVTPFGTVER